ncbi:transporter [Vibrio sp. 404]|uniref:Transporter n=1 Tax=Vibrio marinisediminis TaxID=2758441 RepID=A0A7W2FNA3_9VIBR|nr:transporter [Vibrio marinisediminis]MBA5761246.1 transporter [Vibrio marinisediminis]
MAKPLLYSLPLLLLAPPLFAETQDPATDAKRAQTVADVIDRPGVLTPAGQFGLEASLNYSQNSSNKVSIVGYTVLPALVVGLIEVSDSDRTTITAGLTGRYGLTNATELEIRIPFVYRNDQISARPISSGASDETINKDLDGGGIGDVELAIRHQFNFETAPYWIGSLRIKSDTGKSPYEIDVDPLTNVLNDAPTGSGFWSVEPGISMIYPTDPAVLFASVSYIYNFENDFDISGENANIDLGDTISLGAGLGFAINRDLSLSFGLSHQTILKSKVNGRTDDEAKLLQLDSLTLGINYALSPTTSLNVSAQAGLTEDTPDFQLNVRIPFTF